MSATAEGDARLAAGCERDIRAGFRRRFARRQTRMWFGVLSRTCAPRVDAVRRHETFAFFAVGCERRATRWPQGRFVRSRHRPELSIAYLGCARYPSESNDGPTLQLFLERRELCKCLAGQGRIESDCRARSRTFKSCMVASLLIQGTARF